MPVCYLSDSASGTRFATVLAMSAVVSSVEVGVGRTPQLPPSEAEVRRISEGLASGGATAENPPAIAREACRSMLAFAYDHAASSFASDANVASLWRLLTEATKGAPRPLSAERLQLGASTPAT